MQIQWGYCDVWRKNKKKNVWHNINDAIISVTLGHDWTNKIIIEIYDA